MLYVLDEPSVGLHPSNVVGLRQAIAALAANGNTVVVVEHERDLITAADWIIELGPAAGAHGGTIVAQGTPGQLTADPRSVIGPFLAGTATVQRDHRRAARPRRPDHDRDRGPVQPARRHRRLRAAAPHRGGRAVRGREDRAGPGQPGPRRAGPAQRPAAAPPRPRPRPGRHPPGRPDRRLAHRAERPVDAGHLLRGLRRHPPPVRRLAGRPAPEVEARPLLVQHPRGPVPDLPRPRQHRPRRAVPARHQRRVPDLPRRPVQRRHPGASASTDSPSPTSSA